MMETLVPDFERHQGRAGRTSWSASPGSMRLTHSSALGVQEAAAKFPNRRELALGVPDREQWGAAFRR